MTLEMKWCGVGRKKLDRERFFSAVYEEISAEDVVRETGFNISEIAPRNFPPAGSR